MVRYTGILFLILLYLPPVYGQQIIVKNELIRFGFGVSSMANDNFNDLIDIVEDASALIGPEIPMTRFNDHITFFLDYENELGDDFSYLLRFQYHSDITSGSNYDADQKIEQGMNYEFQLFEAGIDLVYYIPFITIGNTQTRFMFAAGPDLSYVEIESYYFFDQRPVYLQVLEMRRNNMIFGARFFIGVDIPFVESFNLQLRAGYNFRAEKTIPGEVDEIVYDDSGKENSMMDPLIFEDNNKYDFSQYWVTFAFAYRF